MSNYSEEEEFEEWKIQQMIELKQLTGRLNDFNAKYDIDEKTFMKELSILREKAKEKTEELLK